MSKLNTYSSCPLLNKRERNWFCQGIKNGGGGILSKYAKGNGNLLRGGGGWGYGILSRRDFVGAGVRGLGSLFDTRISK